MKSYEYQILRYLPDRVNAEFVNVGLVFYARDEKYLKSKFINRAKRLSSFFHGLDAEHIMQAIKHIKKEFANESIKLKEELALSEPESINNITLDLLAKDDTALVFSEVYKGIDVSLESAFNNLANQLIFKYDSVDDERGTMLDADVWRKVYKKYFEEAGLKNKFVKHIVKTNNDKIEFDFSFKNDIWHCYQPVSFALSREDVVKNKVYRWYGKLQELRTAEEPIKVDLLTILPKKKELRKFIYNILNQNTEYSQFNVIEEEDAPELVRQMEIDFAAHEK